MRATTIHAPRDIRVSDVPDPVISRTDRRDRQGRRRLHLRLGPVAVPRRERHHAGRHDRPRVRRRRRGGRRRGDARSGPATSWSCRSATATTPAPHCRAGVQSACVNLGLHRERPGRVHPGRTRPRAAWSRPTACPTTSLIPSLLTLSDVMATGWHAAVAAGVREGGTAVVVGDGAVGLCGVLAASVMGAETVDRDVAARAAPGDRPRRSAPPTSSPSAARRAATRSRRSPAASAPTPCSSASAPTRR